MLGDRGTPRSFTGTIYSSPLPPSPLLLAWELSVAKGTQSYFRRLPTLCRKLRFSLFFSFKDPINLESQNQAKNIPVGLPSSNQNLSKIGQDVLKLLKNNLTNKHRLQLYIYFSPIPFRISIQFSPSKRTIPIHLAYTPSSPHPLLFFIMYSMTSGLYSVNFRLRSLFLSVLRIFTGIQSSAMLSSFKQWC